MGLTRRERIFYATLFPVMLAILAWAVFILPGDDPAPEPSATPTVALPSFEPSPSPSDTPTPTETPTPTFTPTERFTPETLPTGDDFQQVLQTIFDIRQQAILRRDARILGQIMSSNCSCLALEREGIESFISDGIAFRGGEPEVIDVVVDQRPSEDGAVLLARVVFTPRDRVEATTGDVVSEGEGSEVRFSIVLLRGFGSFDDGRWLIADFEPIAEDA